MDGTGAFAFHSDQVTMKIPLDGFTLWSDGLQPTANSSARVDSPPISGSFPAGSNVAVQDIVFTNTGILQGGVRKSTGEGVAGASVKISITGYSDETTTATNGTYKLAFLPPGTYTVEVSKVHPQGSALTAQKTATVAAGQTTSMEITLPLGAISGTVRSAEETLLPNANVDCDDQDFTVNPGQVETL